MKKSIRNFLENRYVDNFLIGLILLNLIVFIFQTDADFSNKFSHLLGEFELFSIIIFTIEYILRLLTLEKFKDIFKPMMIIDFLAVFPYYMSFVSINTVFLRIFRLFRLLRIAKLARYTKAFERIKQSFINKKDEIVVTAIIFIFGLTMCSIAIYFAEHKTGVETFKSIPSSFWWTIITFTSVGYGDSYPLTTLGKFVGAITAILGVGLHALLIGVVGAAFVAATKNEEEASE